MQINLSYDASTALAPSSFFSTLNQAVQFLDQTFTTPITINIAVGWGEVGGTPLAAGVVGEGGPDGGSLYSYAQVKAALQANVNSSADAAAVATLPATDPTGGGQFYIGGAQEKALGLSVANPNGFDGEVGFQGTVGAGTIEHEITHAMGRIAYLGTAANFGDFSVLDLFRYSRGVLSPTKLNNAYFSADGGKTAINTFDAISDPGDWAGATADAFNAFGGPNDPVSAGDIEVMNILGFGSAAATKTQPTTATTTVSNSGGYSITDPLMIHKNTGGDVYVDHVTNGQMTYQRIGAVGPEWQFDGSGYFGGDGSGNFLLWNTNSGAIVTGKVVGGAAEYTTVGGVGPEWKFDGNASFLGDGSSEFLIRNDNSGALVVGKVVGGSVQYTTVGGVGPEWQFLGTGDLLGDGHAGFLMRNVNDGGLWVGEVSNNHAAYSNAGSIVGSNWQFKGTGDFLGNGKTDILVRDANTGTLYAGQAVNRSFTFTDIGGVGPEWEFFGNGNYLGTGKTDFLMRNTNSGSLYVGEYNGATLQYTRVGGVGSEWDLHSGNIAVLV